MDQFEIKREAFHMLSKYKEKITAIAVEVTKRGEPTKIILLLEHEDDNHTK